ncbi:uncharacterized protein EV154DRAFT_583641 [Mucor mucedo]|uniref:uncharacterized protein n=1 Tax=Mucor mucedo TaxID=29922 RepID=UPI00221F977F|nr:uncharacterized protein EV154DRAFT_583641 [Mucor mucedo]KAI7866213.1 hypothetical protein EV154DRAFT_583641 [Mucor mucedo]
MPNWNQIPAEVLTEIFKLLDRACHDTLECQRGGFQRMLVCKHWCRIARMLLYKEVTMLSIKQHDTFLSCMSRSTTHTNQLVHSFKAFTEMTNVKLTNAKLEEDLGLILNVLPNLQRIEAVPQRASFFTRLLFEHHSLINRPAQLVEIPGFCKNCEQDARAYQYVVWFLKTTLQKMILPDWHIIHYNISTPLEEFKNLTSLELSVTSSSQMYDIGTIVTRCSNLSSLHVVRSNRYDPYEAQENKVIDPTRVQAIPRIVHLQIDGTLVTTSHSIMRLMMLLFPRLHSWFMDTNLGKYPYLEYEGLSKRIPVEIWVQFLNYLSKIRKFYGRNLVICSLPQVLKGISTSTGFCKNIKIRYNEPSFGQRPVLHISSPTAIDSYDDNLLETVVSYFPVNANFNLPHVSLIQQIGFQLEHLTVDLDQVSLHHVITYVESGRDKIMTGHFINHIFQHCPVLKTLVIAGVNLVYCDDGTMEAPASLKLLHFQNCKIYHVMNFLHDLSHRLPSRLELMIIDHCGFSLNECESTAHVDMPSTLFGCLFFSTRKQLDIMHWNLAIKVTRVSKPSVYYRLYDQHKLQTLSNEKEFKMCAKNGQTIAVEITCADIEKLLVRAYGIQILIFPKEQVEYEDGQDYINSSPEFQHVQTEASYLHSLIF